MEDRDSERKLKEEKISEAAEKLCAAINEGVKEPGSSKHGFSEDFRNRMERLIKKERRRMNLKLYLKTAAAAVLISLLLYSFSSCDECKVQSESEIKNSAAVAVNKA